jgi:type IV secretory pathway VirD2 relaxase
MDYYECIVKLVEINTKHVKVEKEREMSQVYVWDEFTLEDLKYKVRDAESLEDLKNAILALLDKLPTEYVK